MKSSILKIVFLAAVGMILMMSCKKQVIYPTDQLPANVPTLTDFGGVSRWGKFVITDAVMYVENSETGVKTMYQHFSATKSRSSLRWDGSQFDIENIIKDTTTYSFWTPISYPGMGKFVLNGDTTKYYDVQYTGSNTSIIEDPTHRQQNLGGSARPFSGQTLDKANKIVTIDIEEVEASIGGQNCHYWTRLTLKKIQEW
jgi:hypothetical protein